MGSLHMVVRVSMKILMNFGIVKMPQLNTFGNCSTLPYLKAMNKCWSIILFALTNFCGGSKV